VVRPSTTVPLARSGVRPVQYARTAGATDSFADPCFAQVSAGYHSYHKFSRRPRTYGTAGSTCTELLEAVDMFSFCFDFAFNKSLSCLDKRAKDGKGIIN
jgi:hypothetical protein